jgi:hypothetical protein
LRAWHRQVITNTVKAAIPGKQHLRQALRRISPYQTDPEIDSSLFDSAVRQIALLQSAGVDIRGRRVLEIGSGWHPILAMTFLAAGAESVTLTDIELLLDARLIRSAIDFVLARRDVLVEKFGADSFNRLKIDNGNVTTMLRHLGLTYIVPYWTELSPDRSVDLIVSCSVLEHIAPETLETMMADFRRILVPGGAMIHFIDCSDHYAMYDKSISRCNFLQYEDWVWRLCCINPQSYHNRLRHSDHAAMLQRHGFRIGFEWRESREKEQREVAAMSLASRFAGRDIEDLAAISSHFVATAT